MAEIHHFTYGAFNPVAAYLMAFLGSFVGLLSTGRAREARTRGRRSRWLIIAAFAIGGGGIWLMHFMAMLGFDVPASPVRYNPLLTVASLGLSVVIVGIGLLVVGHGRRSAGKIVVAGTITGLGVVAMHFTGMAALTVAGTVHYDPELVLASGLIAVAAATTALWFAISVRGWVQISGAAVVMALAVCCMHYTAMAAVQIRLSSVPRYHVSGIQPMLMIVPITLIMAALILGLALSALQAMTEEEFADGAVVSRRGAHAEHPWSLRQASMSAMRRSPETRPSPRPVPRRTLAQDHLADQEVLEPAAGS